MARVKTAGAGAGGKNGSDRSCNDSDSMCISVCSEIF